MTPFVRRFVTVVEYDMFRKIRTAVERLPDIDLGHDEKDEEILLSCHILSRAIANVFALKFVDGFVDQGCEHSWVLTPCGHIIDVYPVATLGGPILVDGTTFLNMGRYLPDRDNHYGERFNQPSFLKSVELITNEIKISIVLSEI